MGYKELAAALDKPTGEALAMKDAFQQRFSGLTRFLGDVRQQCRQEGFVETLFGRRRYLPLIRSSKGAEVSEAERAAVNTTFQVRCLVLALMWCAVPCACGTRRLPCWWRTTR
jgi:DNA polymerase I-like protein with 3'-5' exonuclease and polymerase domains